MALSETLPIFHIPCFSSTDNHHCILHSLPLDTEKEKNEVTLKLYLLVLMSSVCCFGIRNSSVFKCQITRGDMSFP